MIGVAYLRIKYQSFCGIATHLGQRKKKKETLPLISKSIIQDIAISQPLMKCAENMVSVVLAETARVFVFENSAETEAQKLWPVDQDACTAISIRTRRPN